MRKQAEEILAKRKREVEIMNKEPNDTIRREWEVKARLDIDRQIAVELDRLQRTFEAEVSKRVTEELGKHPRNLSGKTLVQ
jgi:NIMA (never in mitosis gene a)-related kinase